MKTKETAYSEDLKATLAEHPEIEAVYFNEKGEWYFSAIEGFKKKVDSKEILNVKSND